MKYQSDPMIVSDKIDWEELGGGVKRKIMGYNDNIMMVQVYFQKGSIGAVHQHVHSQTTYVAKGKFEVNIGGKTMVLNTGDGFYAPPNTDHGVVCLEEGMLLDTFAPIREDFMKG